MKINVLFFIALCPSLTFASDACSLPSQTKSETELINILAPYVRSNMAEYSGFNYSNDARIIAININTGSGLLRLDTYIYGCKLGSCKLLAANFGSPRLLQPELIDNSSEFILKTEEGSIVFRFSLPKPTTE